MHSINNEDTDLGEVGLVSINNSIANTQLFSSSAITSYN